MTALVKLQRGPYFDKSSLSGQIEQVFFSCSVDTIPEAEEVSLLEEISVNPVELALMVGAMVTMIDV